MNARLGSRPTSSANMVNRQRIRKPATVFGAWPAASSDCGHLASRVGDLARDRAAARVGSRLSGSSQTAAQPLADARVAQVVQRDAVRARVGKGDVGCAAAGELGVELDDVADVDDDQERRPAFGGRQRAGVALGLPAGAQHRVVERPWRAPAPELLGFQHEGAAPVAVDATRRVGAVAVRERDRRSNW